MIGPGAPWTAGAGASPGLRLAARAVVAAVFLMALAQTVDLAHTAALLAEIELSTMIGALALFGFSLVLSAWRWRFGLRQMVARPPPVLGLLRLVLLGIACNLFLPTTVGGDLARAEALQRASGRGAAYASVMVDRLLGLIAVLCLGGLALVLAWWQGLVAGWLLVVPATAAGLVLAVLALHRAVARTTWVMARLQPLLDAFRAFGRRPLVPLVSFAVAVLVQLVGTIAPLVLMAQDFGIEASWPVHLMVIPAVILLTLVPVSINGIGVREGALVVLYGQAGVPSDPAFALGIAWTLLITAFGLLGGLSWLLSRRAGAARWSPALLDDPAVRPPRAG